MNCQVKAERGRRLTIGRPNIVPSAAFFNVSTRHHRHTMMTARRTTAEGQHRQHPGLLAVARPPIIIMHLQRRRRKRTALESWAEYTRLVRLM
jgi:hypothetical protein